MNTITKLTLSAALLMATAAYANHSAPPVAKDEAVKGGMDMMGGDMSGMKGMMDMMRAMGPMMEACAGMMKQMAHHHPLHGDEAAPATEREAKPLPQDR